MRRRRGRGEGSIFRRKDGLWAATVTVGRTGTGQRIRKTVYGPTKAEVLDGLLKLHGAAASGLVVESGRLTSRNSSSGGSGTMSIPVVRRKRPGGTAAPQSSRSCRESVACCSRS